MQRMVVAVVLAAGLAGPAAAQVFGPVELRGGILAHSVDGPVWEFSRIQDVNVELLVSLPALDEIVGLGQIRPHAGLTLNLGGLESMAYAGVSWTVPVFDTPLFVEASFGAAIHDGALDGAAYPARNMGCVLNFRESASIGWQIDARTSVMATIEHASHALLCGSDNQGLTNLGLRFGYRF